MLTVYGLPNCDTCRKATKWLEAEKIPYQFHNVREDGPGKTSLNAWIKLHGLDVVVNKRSTTWRGLSDDIKSGLSEKNAASLLMDNPSHLKRPVFDLGNGNVIIGFKAKEQDELKAQLT